MTRLLNKKINYCDECPYHFAQSLVHFCTHVGGTKIKLESSKIVLNDMELEAYVIPHGCPLPLASGE